jgi:hypothetical protein
MVESVQPASRPDLELQSTAVFADTWVSEAHWEAVDRMAERRRPARSG